MSLHLDGLIQFLDVLPAVVRERLERGEELTSLVEVVLDYGRPAEARYRNRVERWFDVVVSENDIEIVSKSIGEFGTDNRAGIERTLHRISAIRNRHGKIIGLTCRVGRAMEGTIDMIDDIVRSGQSILLLGKPGVGKTTKLREVARVLADEANKRVVIVDTSNEIAGDGDVPHPGIGSARRMQVRVAAEQHNVMIEAVENHMPEVIVIDEIGTEAEAAASRTIAERGVQLIGTAHGQTLENLMLNPTLADLIGGIQAVTLSDAEAQRRGTQKTVLERKAPPTFDVVIELLDYDRLAVHNNVQKTVDMILRGAPPRPEIRVRTGAGLVEVVQTEQVAEMSVGGPRQLPGSAPRGLAVTTPEGVSERKVVQSPDRVSAKVARELGGHKSRREEPKEESANVIRIFPYGINRSRLERAIREKKAAAFVTSEIRDADAVIAMRSTQQTNPKKLRDMAGRALNTVVVKSNTFSQIATALDDLFKQSNESSEEESKALEEAQQGIDAVLQSGKPFELSPASASIRKVQHRFVEAKRLASEGFGEEPQRRLRILPTRL
jgi:stage III sporulation protein SpoIIIAA